MQVEAGLAKITGKNMAGRRTSSHKGPYKGKVWCVWGNQGRPVGLEQTTTGRDGFKTRPPEDVRVGKLTTVFPGPWCHVPSSAPSPSHGLQVPSAECTVSFSHGTFGAHTLCSLRALQDCCRASACLALQSHSLSTPGSSAPPAHSIFLRAQPFLRVDLFYKNTLSLKALHFLISCILKRWPLGLPPLPLARK